MAQDVPSSQVNGASPATVDQRVQDAFYEQLLQLRGAVLADSHPRFRLPADVKLRLRSAKSSTPASILETLQQVPGLTNDSQSRPQHSGYLSNASRNAIAHEDNRVAHASQAGAAKMYPSGIDPVLLTKSDDLIRAEILLKRGRIEKQLKESGDQRKQITRRDADAESNALLDLPEILQKAWDIVKPVSGLKPATNLQTVASDSFDENSYYSSQVNDWSSEASTDSRRNEAAAAAAAAVNPTRPIAVNQGATGPASSASFPKHRQSKVERNLDPQVYQNRSHVSKPQQDRPSLYANDTEAAYDGEREDSEEYSPPAAEAFSGADADAMDLDDDSSEFVPEEPTLPSPQVPVITNHLTHIAAPQPARVSPLAVTRVPGLDQSAGRKTQADRNISPRAHGTQALYGQRVERVASEESTTSPRNSGQHSPVGPLTKKQRTRLRKRKREAEAAEKTRKKLHGHVAAKSPEPYIKPEPVSPPPFANVSELQPAKRRSQRLVKRGAATELAPDVEIVSPHEFRPRPRPSYYQDAPPPQPLRYGSPASPSTMGLGSPAGYVRPKRDDQDLRRVASLHAAQRPLSPGYSPVAPYRTVSQPHMDQPVQPAARYRVEPGRAPSLYMRSERSMSPQQIGVARDPYMQRLQSPGVMAPPPLTRRIVVDQYGNKYVAADDPPASMPPPPAPSSHNPRMSIAPQARHDGEAGYERAPSRASVIYAPQAAQSVYDDGVARMPPPPHRRVTVQADTEGPDYRAYRQREYSRQPEIQYYRDEPVFMREGPVAPPPLQRGSVYPSEHVAPPGHARAYSVRPDAESIRYVSRAPSMMPQTEYVRMAESNAPPPGLRAVSVAPGAEYGRPSELRYVYGHPGAYPMAPPASRYAADDGMSGTAPPQRTEIYVDQYGREVRRAPAYH